MKSFIAKYKTQIISIITAISALALALTSLGGEVTRVCEIVIAIDAVIIALLKTGFDNKFVDNSVALLKLLQDQYNISPASQNTTSDKIAGSSSEQTTTPRIKVISSDGSITYIGGKDPYEKEEFKTVKVEKLNDEQLKELVESYLHPVKNIKEDDAIEEKTE